MSPEPPPRRVGALVALALVALCTLLIYPLKQAAPVVSLGVVYMLAVVIVSVTWGVWLGVATSLLSALAYNYFHLPPVGHLTISNGENWVALIAFVIVSMLASSVAEVTRARSREAAERRREADLAAEMARLLLGGRRLSEDLPTASARLSQVLGLPSAAIELEAVEGDERRVAFPLREGPRRLGTLLVPADTPEATLRRLQERVVPALESLLSAALERDSLLADVVETAALRRTDVVKTALLRAVSHDLRSPLTAISAAADAVGSPSLSEQERHEMAALIQQETQRLSRLVDNLLDLSRLEAGAAEPHAALDVGGRGDSRRARGAHARARGLQPLDRSRSTARERRSGAVGARVRERAGERAPALGGSSGVGQGARGAQPWRHRRGAPADLVADEEHSGTAFDTGLAPLEGPSGGPAGDRLVVRVVDRGPGIPPAQLERVFEPFYRAGTPQGGHRGSGLGLAIARGFTESNGGRLHVESLPGQGATFVFELPLAAQQPSHEPKGAVEVAASSEHVR